jgi:hypothetical protein
VSAASEIMTEAVIKANTRQRPLRRMAIGTMGSREVDKSMLFVAAAYMSTSEDVMTMIVAGCLAKETPRFSPHPVISISLLLQ